MRAVPGAGIDLRPLFAAVLAGNELPKSAGCGGRVLTLHRGLLLLAIAELPIDVDDLGGGRGERALSLAVEGNCEGLAGTSGVAKEEAAGKRDSRLFCLSTVVAGDETVRGMAGALWVGAAYPIAGLGFGRGVLCVSGEAEF